MTYRRVAVPLADEWREATSFRFAGYTGLEGRIRTVYSWTMLQYHAAFYLPRSGDRMVVAEVLDFPGVVSQGFDLADARTMIAGALEEVAESYLDEGCLLPTPLPDASDIDADLIELLPLAVTVARTPQPVRR